MENRLRHASGPVHAINIPSITFIVGRAKLDKIDTQGNLLTSSNLNLKKFTMKYTISNLI